MAKCEWCNKEFDNKGKLRFCSRSCRSKYAASKVKNHVSGFTISDKTRKPKEGRMEVHMV